MQAASLEKLEDARTLANEFAENIRQRKSNQAESKQTPNSSVAATHLKILKSSRQESNAFDQTDDSQLKASSKDISEKNKVAFGAKFIPEEQDSKPKISAFEVAHWRNRLWLNPLLALTALLWMPFMIALFTDMLAINLAVLGVLSFIEYRLIQKTCQALHTVKTPLWQKSWSFYIVRRALIIAAMLTIFSLVVPYESWLLISYLSAIAIYWLIQIFMLRQRRQQQHKQLAQFS